MVSCKLKILAASIPFENTRIPFENNENNRLHNVEKWVIEVGLELQTPFLFPLML